MRKKPKHWGKWKNIKLQQIPVYVIMRVGASCNLTTMLPLSLVMIKRVQDHPFLLPTLVGCPHSSELVVHRAQSSDQAF